MQIRKERNNIDKFNAVVLSESSFKCIICWWNGEIPELKAGYDRAAEQGVD